MSTLVLTAVRPLYPRVSISQLAVIARFLLWAERLTVASGVALILVVSGQLLYPHNRSLPRVQAALGLNATSGTELTSKLKALNSRNYRLRIADKNYVLNADEVGTSIDVATASQQLTSYSWRQRLIPFSIFRSSNDSLPLHIDEQARNVSVQRLVIANNYAPKDAGVVKTSDNNYRIVPDSRGLQTFTTSIVAAIDQLGPTSATAATVPATVVKPAVTDDSATAAIQKVEAVKNTPPVLVYNGTKYPLPADKLAAWSNISLTADKKLAITYDTAAIRAWLTTSVPLVIEQPQTIIVTTEDGHEVSRTSAADGKGIDLDATTASLTKAIQDGTGEVQASLMTLTAQQRVIRKYTPTNAGIGALINDWLGDHPGLNAGVSFQEIGGQARVASYQGDTQFRTASIYKLFVTAYLYSRFEAGTLSPSSGAMAGKTIEQCIEAMMVVSDNDCGMALANSFGWSTIATYAHQIGATSTVLAGVPPASTPNDTAKVLSQIATGTLLTPADQTELLGFMARNIYRTGIPAGTPGGTVQDKVGFLPGMWNDAAIVHASKANYVLVVYTSGSNADAIRDLANRLQILLNT